MKVIIDGQKYVSASQRQVVGSGVGISYQNAKRGVRKIPVQEEQFKQALDRECKFLVRNASGLHTILLDSISEGNAQAVRNALNEVQDRLNETAYYAATLEEWQRDGKLASRNASKKVVGSGVDYSYDRATKSVGRTPVQEEQFKGALDRRCKFLVRSAQNLHSGLLEAIVSTKSLAVLDRLNEVQDHLNETTYYAATLMTWKLDGKI